MIEQLTRGMNIYYRGYVIHEDIRRIYYTIYGPRPDRAELTSAGSSLESMRWVDQNIAGSRVDSIMVWPALFPAGHQPASAGSW